MRAKEDEMKPNIKFFRIVDVESTNPAMSHDGGDYYFGRTVAVNQNMVVGLRYWTSAEFSFCPKCGRFERNMEEHEENFHGGKFDFVPVAQADGWQNGEEVTSQYLLQDWEAGEFAKVRY